ncbi:kinase-like domain-containing protein [Rhizophagus clarus]|uniref:Kinase-like domain-containing protein n=1 Tax=Rhizophagus clarus TaxID=94130 RepID=A0A8H3M8E3_9GLOM|nr:kinase-like domain-containing protein [Rhizophagus clarus]
MLYQQNFENWTIGNNDVNKLIQDIQLSAHVYYKVSEKALEWIPYDRFCKIRYIENGRFGKMCRANWIDGCADEWD